MFVYTFLYIYVFIYIVYVAPFFLLLWFPDLPKSLNYGIYLKL